jgi:hypothetical protein
MVVILKPKLCVLVLVALPAVATTARADDLKKLLNEKFQIAEIFEAGSHAAEKCPGLRVIEDNIRATADEAGVTDDVIYTPEWRFWERRGQTNARPRAPEIPEESGSTATINRALLNIG